jgi:hypothetical protein|tara:strand:+ start:315 stop:692 length:378 start_codon:yes stop_codon:yes gene_type:complete
MDQKIVQWVQCDNQIKEYNDKMKEKMKPLKEMKDKIEQEIIVELDVPNKEKSDLPTFNIQALNTSIKPQVNNSYEGLTNKFLTECFSEYFNSEEEAKKLLLFIKSKRSIEKKYSLRRDILMDLND